ncbi:MAG: M67 family metallopeptidase [Flavobacteriales bacterium]|nr:M67 family metallopeptidase [Flavobacteriales bacterium]NNK80654.1 M67 family metallopeptidase [Flavobacteriales bacterium]
MAILNNHIADSIKAHGERTYPFECCGFLFGKDENDVRQISDIMPVENNQKENKERRFLVSPGDYLRAEKYAEIKGLSLIGIYHSHPDHPAIPSEHDRKQAMPFFSYLIVSIQKGIAAETRSWLLGSDMQFKEEQLIEKVIQF